MEPGYLPVIHISQGPQAAVAEGASRRNGSSQIFERLSWEWRNNTRQGFWTNEQPLTDRVDQVVEELRRAGVLVRVSR